MEGEPPLLNIGTGEDVTIRELAGIVAKEIGFVGNIVFDTTKPDGAPRKLLDVTRVHHIGWRHRISLEDGIRQTCEWYMNRSRLVPLRMKHGGSVHADYPEVDRASRFV